tara:strand:+ start:771 stop:875 length:105 start_codon:yes stop_codon:yes gene_type:complete
MTNKEYNKILKESLKFWQQDVKKYKKYFKNESIK